MLDLVEGATDPTALWNMLTLNSAFPSSFLIKAYIPEKGIMHSKVYISENGDDATLITGSANLSAAALQENVEHGLRLVGTTDEQAIRDALAEFEQLWTSPHAFPIDEEAARLYEIYSGLHRASLARGQRRARGSWQALTTHLAEVPTSVFEWPSTRTAFIIGAITARGYLDTRSSKVSIPLLFRSNAYKGGRITVRDSFFDASEVLPSIPETIAKNASRVFPNCTVTTEKMRVEIEFHNDLDSHAFCTSDQLQHVPFAN